MWSAGHEANPSVTGAPFVKLFWPARRGNLTVFLGGCIGFMPSFQRARKAPPDGLRLKVEGISVRWLSFMAKRIGPILMGAWMLLGEGGAFGDPRADAFDANMDLLMAGFGFDGTHTAETQQTRPSGPFVFTFRRSFNRLTEEAEVVGQKLEVEVTTTQQEKVTLVLELLPLGKRSDDQPAWIISRSQNLSEGSSIERQVLRAAKGFYADQVGRKLIIYSSQKKNVRPTGPRRPVRG